MLCSAALAVCSTRLEAPIEASNSASNARMQMKVPAAQYLPHSPAALCPMAQAVLYVAYMPHYHPSWLCVTWRTAASPFAAGLLPAAALST